jgi:hypothetical protein
LANQSLPLVLLTSCLLGLLGASLGAFFTLRRAASTRNNIPIRTTIWYYSQPVLGFPLGAVIFGLTLVFLQVSVPDLNSIENPLLVYVAAFTGGFLFNFAQDLFTTRRKYTAASSAKMGSDFDKTQ